MMLIIAMEDAMTRGYSTNYVWDYMVNANMSMHHARGGGKVTQLMDTITNLLTSNKYQVGGVWWFFWRGWHIFLNVDENEIHLEKKNAWKIHYITSLKNVTWFAQNIWEEALVYKIRSIGGQNISWITFKTGKITPFSFLWPIKGVKVIKTNINAWRSMEIITM